MADDTSFFGKEPPLKKLAREQGYGTLQGLANLLQKHQGLEQQITDSQNTEQQKRDSLLLGFVNSNPGMMNRLSPSSQNYIKKLLETQGH